MATLANLSRSEVQRPYLTQRLTMANTVLDVAIISTAFFDTQGSMYGIAADFGTPACIAKRDQFRYEFLPNDTDCPALPGS